MTVKRKSLAGMFPQDFLAKEDWSSSQCRSVFGKKGVTVRVSESGEPELSLLRALEEANRPMFHL